MVVNISSSVNEGAGVPGAYRGWYLVTFVTPEPSSSWPVIVVSSGFPGVSLYTGAESETVKWHLPTLARKP